MSWWTDAVIGVPRVTWKKLEDLVDEVYYLQYGEELDRRERKGMTERLATRVLEEYVEQYFGQSVKTAAEMFRQRQRETRHFLG